MTREAQTTQGKTQRIWTSTQKNETKQSSSMSNPLHMKTLLCNSRPWSSTETHPPTTEPMPEKLRKDSNPNPNLELLSMAETGKPKSTKKLPSKLEWETPSPPRRRPPKSQQHQYTDPLRSSRVERTNPTLPNTHLVGMGMYTAWQNRGPPNLRS